MNKAWAVADAKGKPNTAQHESSSGPQSGQKMPYPHLFSNGRGWGRGRSLRHGLVGNFKYENNIQPRLI